MINTLSLGVRSVLRSGAWVQVAERFVVQACGGSRLKWIRYKEDHREEQAAEAPRREP